MGTTNELLVKLSQLRIMNSAWEMSTNDTTASLKGFNVTNSSTFSHISSTVTEPESNSTTLNENVEPSTKSASLNENVVAETKEPVTKSASLDENVEPSAKSASLDENVEPGTNCATIDENVFPPTKSASMDENVVPLTKSASLDENVEPGTNSASMDENVVPPTKSANLDENLAVGILKRKISAAIPPTSMDSTLSSDHNIYNEDVANGLIKYLMKNYIFKTQVFGAESFSDLKKGIKTKVYNKIYKYCTKQGLGMTDQYMCNNIASEIRTKFEIKNFDSEKLHKAMINRSNK